MALSVDWGTKVITVPKADLQPLPLLTVADASPFAAGGDIAGDGDAGNTGVGVVRSISGSVVQVATTSGAWVAGNGVDNADPYVADETTITALDDRLFELDVDAFRLELKDLEDGEVGIAYPDTHRHNTVVLLSGVTYARVVEIINGYTVEFEDGAYAVTCVGANHNLADAKVLNSVSLIIGNTGGLIETTTPAPGLTGAEATDLADLAAIHRNRRITDPDTGVETVYENDDATPRFTRNIYEDADAAQPYRGQGLERVERLT